MDIGHKNHCENICPVFVISRAQKPDIYRCIGSNRDRLGFLWYYGPKNQTYTVASAPTVTGSGFCDITSLKTRHIPLHQLQPWQARVFVISGAQKPDIYCCISSNHDRLWFLWYHGPTNQTYTVASAPTMTGSGFYAAIWIIFGRVYSR